MRGDVTLTSGPNLAQLKPLTDFGKNIFAEVKEHVTTKRRRREGVRDVLGTILKQTADKIADAGPTAKTFVDKSEAAIIFARKGSHKAEGEVNAQFKKQNIGPLLNRPEYKTLGQRIERGEPMTPRQKAVADTWQKVHTDILDLSEAAGIRVFDPKTGEHREVKRLHERFFPNMPKADVFDRLVEAVHAVDNPHYAEAMKPKRFVEVMKTYNEMLDYQVENKVARDRSEAASRLREYASRNMNGWFAGIELARGSLWPEHMREWKPDRVMETYIRNAFRRIGEVTEFGVDESIPTAMIEKIRSESSPGLGERNARWAMDHYQRLFRGEYVNPINYYEANLTTMTKLGFSILSTPKQVSTIGQILGTHSTGSPVRGPWEALKGAAKYLTDKETRQFIKDSSAIIEDYTKNFADVLERGVLGTATGVAVKASGIPIVDGTVRRWQAVTTMMWAKDAARYLRRKPTGFQADAMRRMFTELGAKPEQVNSWAADGKIPKSAMEDMIVRSVKKFQFEADAFTRPIWGHNAYGRMVLRLRNFAFQQANMWGKYVIPEARKGNVWPLVYIVGAGIGTGELYTAIRNTALNKERPDETLLERLGNDLIAGGTFGLITDVFRSTRGGQMEGIKDSFLPAITDTIFDIGTTIKRIAVETRKTHKRDFGTRVREELPKLQRQIPILRNLNERFGFMQKPGERPDSLRSRQRPSRPSRPVRRAS